MSDKLHHAIEILTCRRLVLRDHIRTVRRNENQIMAGIGYAEEERELRSIEAALAILNDQAGSNERGSR